MHMYISQCKSLICVFLLETRDTLDGVRPLYLDAQATTPMVSYINYFLITALNLFEHKNLTY